MLCVCRYLWSQKEAVGYPGARGPSSSALGSSGRAACAPNHWAISPTPIPKISVPASLWNVTVLVTETHRRILPTSWPLSSLAVSPFDSVPFAWPEFHFSYKLGTISKQNLRAQISLTSSSNPSWLPHSGASSPVISSTVFYLWAILPL